MAGMDDLILFPSVMDVGSEKGLQGLLTKTL